MFGVLFAVFMSTCISVVMMLGFLAMGAVVFVSRGHGFFLIAGFLSMVATMVTMMFSIKAPTEEQQQQKCSK